MNIPIDIPCVSWGSQVLATSVVTLSAVITSLAEFESATGWKEAMQILADAPLVPGGPSGPVTGWAGKHFWVVGIYPAW